MAEFPLRVAVTGSSGYIAGRLIRRLECSADVEFILAADIRPPTERYSHKVEFAPLDVTSPFPDLFAEHRIDAIVHLAYILNPGRRGATARRVNVDGTDNVLDACARAGVRHVIYLSSASVYGPRAGNPDFLTELDPTCPISGFQYSEDKAEAEVRLLRFTESGPSTVVTILRVCPVMGPNADNFIARAFRKPLLPMIGDADPPMQFLHEDDLEEILFRCLERRLPGIYNAAGDGTILWSEMADAMGVPTLRLPETAWRSLIWTAWHIGIQSDSPPGGLDFIRYRWTVSAEKLKAALDTEFEHTSREAWESFAARATPTPSR